MDPTARLRELPWEALSGLQRPAVAAIDRVLDGQAAERVVDRTLRDHSDLAAPQRTAMVEAIFGVALWRRRLAWHAGVEAAPGQAAALLFALLRDLASVADADAARLAGLEGAPPARRDAPATLALRWSLPDWMAAAFARDLESEADELCAALNAPGPVCLRANSLKGSRDDLAARLRHEGVVTRPGRWSPLALVVEGPRPNILGLRAHRGGLFEVQDEGSQVLGLLAGARPGEAILDFCAGAGGKTLLLAGELRGSGELIAHDADGEKLDRLERRASRAGIGPSLRVHRGAVPEGLACDAVLVDAPCSELGALRRGPDARFRISEKEAADLPALQLGILEAASRNVRPGGRLVYATCTLRREENEDVASAFLEEHPEFELRLTGAGWLPGSLRRGPYLATFPHRHGTDGFFAAELRRSFV